MKQLIIYFILILLPLLLFSCSQDSPVSSPDDLICDIPEITNDGWQTASLESVGLNEEYFVNLMRDLSDIEDHDVHSILVIKDNLLVFEKYFPGETFSLGQPLGGAGFTRDDKHNLASATKSFASALIGIAIDKGFIQSVDEKVFDYFPEHQGLLTYSPEKNDMTIEHLLKMMSGLDWDDYSTPYSDQRNDMNQLFHSSDPVRYILLKELVDPPGTYFEYRNCNTNLLGEIVHKASGQMLDEFSENYLFSKLGITNYEWQMISDDVVFCSGDLRLRPRDMAKFGQLFLDDGVWEGEQVISQDWTNISRQRHVIPSNYSNEFPWANGYGYQWWLWSFYSHGEHYSCYMASGWGGQWIVVIDQLNMVVVSTGGNYFTDIQMSVQTMLTDYICPSAR